MAVANFTFLTSTGVIVDTVQVNLINSAACRAWQYAVMLNQNTRSVKNILTKHSIIVYIDILPQVLESYGQRTLKLKQMNSIK